MAKPVQQALTLLKQAHQQINQLLSDPLYVHRRLEIKNDFDKIARRLEFMGAVTEPENKPTAKKGTDPFGPITNFMGEEIVLAKGVKPADLRPSDPDKERYLAKVDKLYAQFITIAPEGILNAYTIPEELLVLRGVAKRAGVEDYETRELTIKFIEDIALAIEMKEEEGKTQKKIEADLLKQNKTTNDPKPITQADIDADVDLQKIGAKPGDIITTDPSGKKTKLVKKA